MALPIKEVTNMSELEKEEFITRVHAMSEEEHILFLHAISDDFLIDELACRVGNYRRILNKINEVAK